MASKKTSERTSARKRTGRKKGTARHTAAKRKAAPKKRWSAKVMQKSDALDLDSGVFKSRSSRTIAESLKRSAERSKRRKGTPFQSAMSMLNFYINRGGKNLAAGRKKILEGAKDKLRELFHRTKKK